MVLKQFDAQCILYMYVYNHFNSAESMCPLGKKTTAFRYQLNHSIKTTPED